MEVHGGEVVNEEEIMSLINHIREMKENTIGIVNDLGNNWRNLSMDISYTNLVLAESNLILALSHIEKVK